MKIMRVVGLALLAAGTWSSAAVGAESVPALIYDKPATKWTEALPVGNGRIGAMVFGGTRMERLQINESTLWGGGPHDYTNPEALANLGEVRNLIFAGKMDEAETLAASMMGKPELLMPYQPFCDLRLEFPGREAASGYTRSLRLDEAIAATQYRVGSVEYRREVFASFPDQVLVMRLTASEAGKLSFGVVLDSPQPGTEVVDGGEGSLLLTGQIGPRQNAAGSWTGSWEQPGERFAAVLRVRVEGGTVRGMKGRLEVSGATSVTLLLSNATSFRNYRDVGGDAVADARNRLAKASQNSYVALRRHHIEDFRPMFSRVTLTLPDAHPGRFTDARVQNYAQDEDPGLLALYFAFGRYVLISSSRPGGQPANLQGIWNEEMVPAWGSKWTTNINLEMNYWQADAGNLWETQEPLWGLIRDLRKSGSETARVDYAAKGWVLHHNTDLWRATTPVDGPWGIWPTGGVWLANQMWEHYSYSGDREFLRLQAYPAMKEAAEFVLSILVEGPAGSAAAGLLVTIPSTSPENQYLWNGKAHSLTYAPTMDIELIRELFANCEEAATVLGTDETFREELAKAMRRLPALKIGKQGQLQEWIEDYPEVEPLHRHVSHLYALYPGHGISLKKTPELAGAAKKSLEMRGDGGTGWSAVWRAALWARLQNPEHAYANLKFLMTTSTLPNLFDLCPPFQIDGNLGGPAAITEMLVQSEGRDIVLLPALPSKWTSGSLRGVRVHGGAKVDIAWASGELTRLEIRAGVRARYLVRYGGHETPVKVMPGKAVVLDRELRRLAQ